MALQQSHIPVAAHVLLIACATDDSMIDIDKDMKYLTTAVCCVQVYGSLSAGNWSFTVMAVDAAGNQEVGPFSTYNWTVSLSPGYPVMASNSSIVTR